jgi:hypothetical protein
MRRILLDADLVIEFVINRSMFQEKVERLLEIINVEGVQFYLSDFGLKKIREIVKVMNGQKASKEMISSLKQRFEIKPLTVTKPIIDEARLLNIEDFDSSIEVSLAINSNISAIITHRTSDFFGSKLNVCSLTDFQERENLEKIFSKETSDRPMVLDIKDKIASLNYLYALPSYASEESLRRNKLYQKLVNSDDVTSLSPIHEPVLSKYRESIAKSSRLAINKELINPISAAFATSAIKSMADGLSALHPSQDSSLLKYRESIAKSSRLAINKELINPISAAFATSAIKSMADGLSALHPSQDSSLLKYRESIAKSSRLAINRELINPISAAFATSVSKSISDGLSALCPSQDSSLSKYRESIARSSRLAINKELMNPVNAVLATNTSKSIADSLGEKLQNTNR